MQMSKNAVIGVVVAAVVIAAVAAFWYFGREEEPKPPADIAPLAESETPDIGAEIGSQVGGGAPIPSASPYANPIEGAYRNPFE